MILLASISSSIKKKKTYPLVHPKADFGNFDTLMVGLGMGKAKIYPPHGFFFP